MYLKGSTLRTTQNYIDALITEQWVTFHLDHPDTKDYVNQTACMCQFRSFIREGSRTQPPFSHLHSCRCEGPSRSRSSGHGATEDWPEKLGVLGRRKKFEVPVAVAKVEDVDRCTCVADREKGEPPSPKTLAVRKQLQRKAEAPSSAPQLTQLSTGEVINVSKQDEQVSKFTLTACRIEDIEETPPARFRDLQYPLWVINADLFVEYDSTRFVPKWLFDVMMLGKDVIFYGEAHVVHRIGRDMQRLWRMAKDTDPTTAPFYHARLPVYSWLSGPVTSNMY